MRRSAIYAGTAACLVGLAALAASVWFEPRTRTAVWTGLAVAWLVQAVAFAILIAASVRRPKLVVAGWTAGSVLRLAVVGLLAWLTLGEVWRLPAEPTLVALVAAMFALLLLEPVVFRYRFGDR